MKKFSDDKNYGELVHKLQKRRDPDGIEDPTPKLSELPDGDYNAMRYGYTIELEDGRRYKTEYGVRCSRRHCGGLKKITVKNGKLVGNSNFSGLTEVSAGLQGMSYGSKPLTSSDVTRLTFDDKGFKLPDGVKSVFKLKTKSYSMQNKRGIFTGGMKTPSIAISKDNSIIRDKEDSNKNNASSSSSDNKVTNVTLDWNKGKPFHLAVEPWITTPLMSDANDGIYIGNVKGDKFDTGKSVFTLMIKVTVDYPESVICLIKNQKAFIFKQSQLTASVGSRIFSNDGKINCKQFSDTQSDINYTFEYIVSEPKFEMQALIGTLIMSVAFGHLMHLCATDYASHMALDEYYKEMPEKVDRLAENYLSTVKSANFQVCIVPKSTCPIQYLETLHEYVIKYQNNKLQNESAFSSLIDDIVNFIGSVLYKLKRLKSGRKLFSIVDDTKMYADRNINITRDQVAGLKQQVVDTIMIYIKKFRKSPIKEIKTTDQRKIKQYVNNRVVDDKSFIEIMEALLKGLGDGITSLKV